MRKITFNYYQSSLIEELINLFFFGICVVYTKTIIHLSVGESSRY